MLLGTRVVRGPDWNLTNDEGDGGEGFVGTVVGIVGKSCSLPERWVSIQWDSGMRQMHRVGHDRAHDLRVLDSAPTGLSHSDVRCHACHQSPIPGIRWRCLDCKASCNLCTHCYMRDEHLKDHGFERIDTPGKTGKQVGKRFGATRIQSRGIFLGAKVMRGPDWRYKDQDGGKGKEGMVTEITNWKNVPLSAVVISWDDADKHNYRLGYKGKVDVRCTVSAVGGFYYRDHLPILGKVALKRKEGSRKKKAVKQSFPEETVNDVAPVPANEEDARQCDQYCRRDRGDPKASPKEAGRTLLHKAAIQGQWEIAKKYLDDGGNVNQRDKFQMTPLHLACWYGQEVIVKLLLECGADINAIDKKTALEKAIRKGQQEIVTVLEKRLQRKEYQPFSLRSLSKTATLCTDKRTGYNLLQALCLEGDYNKVVMILVHLGDPTKELKYESTMNDACMFPGKTASDIAESSKSLNHKQLMELFEEVHKKVESLSELHRCSHHNDAESIVELVVENDHPIDTLAIGNRTPLLWASPSSTGKVMSALLELGADMNSRREDGNTAMILAVEWNNYTSVRLLADYGADLNAWDDKGETPLHHAINRGHHSLSSALIAFGCNVNIQDKAGYSPLHLATKTVDTSLLKLLLERMADPNPQTVQDVQDRTYLLRRKVTSQSEWYYILANKPTLSLFFKKTNGGIDCSSVDVSEFGAVLDYGFGDPPEELEDLATSQFSSAFDGAPDRTPLHFACEDNVPEIIDFLVSYGADINARDADGYTPLHTAACHGKLEAVKKLVELSTDVSLVSRCGMNAVQLAVLNEEKEMEDFLKSYL